jgi:tetratricopeptide (TPR) repeat protein
MTTIRSLLPLAFLLAACGSSSVYKTSTNYARLLNFTLAFDVLEQERLRRIAAGDEIDEEFADAHRKARLEYLLDRGQRRIFLDMEDAALMDLAGVLAMHPQHPEALTLRDRALWKKASRAAARGDEHYAKNELEQALASYIESERSIPGFEPAVEGTIKVGKQVDRMNARAQRQFLEAVRKLPEFRFVEVRWHANNAVTNDPSRGDAAALQVRAQREMAQAALVRAEQCIAKDNFGAALLEFREARRLDPAVPGIDGQVDRMQREVEANWLVERAQMEMRMGGFEIAREQLGKALAFASMPKTRANISELMLDARRLEGDVHYNEGRDFELLGKKQAALGAYEALVRNWPEGLLDEQARIDALRTDIAAAEVEYAAAETEEAAGNLQAALDHMLVAQRFCADLKDVEQRVVKLRERIAAAAGTGSGS